MVVGQIRQYKARQVSLYPLINRGNSNLASTCTYTCILLHTIPTHIHVHRHLMSESNMHVSRVEMERGGESVCVYM